MNNYTDQREKLFYKNILHKKIFFKTKQQQNKTTTKQNKQNFKHTLPTYYDLAVLHS